MRAQIFLLLLSTLLCVANTLKATPNVPLTASVSDDYLFLCNKAKLKLPPTMTPADFTKLFAESEHEDVARALKNIRRHFEDDKAPWGAQELRKLRVPQCEETWAGWIGKTFPNQCDAILCLIAGVSMVECGVFNWAVASMWGECAVANCTMNCLFCVGASCCTIPAVRSVSKLLCCTGLGQCYLDKRLAKKLTELVEDIYSEVQVTAHIAHLPNQEGKQLPTLEELVYQLFIKPYSPLDDRKGNNNNGVVDV